MGTPATGDSSRFRLRLLDLVVEADPGTAGSVPLMIIASVAIAAASIPLRIGSLLALVSVAAGGSGGSGATTTRGSGSASAAAAERMSRLVVSMTEGRTWELLADADKLSVDKSCCSLVGEGGTSEAMWASPLIAVRTAEPPHLKQRTGRLWRSRSLNRSRSSNSSCLLGRGWTMVRKTSRGCTNSVRYGIDHLLALCKFPLAAIDVPTTWPGDNWCQRISLRKKEGKSETVSTPFL